MSGVPRAALVVVLVAGCNQISGVEDLDFESSPSPSSSSVATGATASSTGVAGSGGAGSGGAGTGAAAGAGGSGGNGGVGTCGDGIIDAGEECDGGPSGAVGCSADCLVECDGPGDVHDRTTHHCYHRDLADAKHPWDAARTFCQTTWGGGDLLVLETLEEYQSLLTSLPLPSSGFDWFWIGGGDQVTQNVFLWIDGSPVTFPFQMPPWQDLEPSGNGDCLTWRTDPAPATEGLGDLVCTTPYLPFCERPPPGAPAP